MKSILFVVLIALAVSSSFAAKVKGSCPEPEKPKVDDWLFVNFLGTWKVIGRSEQTVPSIVDNTLRINVNDQGEVNIHEEGYTRTKLQSVRHKYMTTTVGDFDGKSYYDVATDEYDPFSFNITTSDGHRGQFWMPYESQNHEEAVMASCFKIDDSTVDVKAWFVSTKEGVSASQEVKDLVKSLTGQDYIEVCQGKNC